MKAYVTMSELYNNNSLMGFFFRTQSKDTFLELLSRSSMDSDDVMDKIEEYTDERMDGDLDTLEGMFYEESVEELAEEFGIELTDDEDDRSETPWDYSKHFE